MEKRGKVISRREALEEAIKVSEWSKEVGEKFVKWVIKNCYKEDLDEEKERDKFE